MSENKEKLLVALACDKGFAPHSGVVIESLLASTKGARPIEIHILDGGIRAIDRYRLKSFERRYSNCRISLFDASGSFEQMSSNKAMNFSRATYYRFLLPKLLPDESRILYLDSDLIVLDDLFELFSTDLGSCPIAACQDLGMKCMVRNEHRTPETLDSLPAGEYLEKYLGFSPEQISSYFNAGVLLMDLDKLREICFEEKVEALSKKHDKAFWFLDQDVLNSIFLGSYHSLDWKWNFQTFDLKSIRSHAPSSLEPYQKAEQDAKVIHYVGVGNKPWLFPGNDRSHFYWYHLRSTPWYEEVFAEQILAKQLSKMEKRLDKKANERLVYYMQRYSWRSRVKRFVKRILKR